MTPQEAIKILDQIVAEVNTSRIGHAKISKAVQTLQELIEEKENGKN